MSNYTKTTNFASKDNLSPGNPLKIVKGTEIDTEFNNIQTAVATKTDNSAANITGGSITGITDLAVADGGTGASTATAALNNLLPTQTGNANKYLQTDGTNATWDAVSLSTADITGTLPVANGGTGVTSSTGTGNVVLSNSPTLVTPALGTPASGVATNLTGLPISTGVSGLGTGVATFLGTPSSANLASAVTDETGSGALVFANSPTLVTPALGTPSSGTLTNATGLPISTGVSGLGTGVATFLATPSSANLASAVSDETGSGALVFANSPTLVTPALGTPSALVGTNITGTASGLTAGNVTTNANLTGAVTSVGNATSLGSFSSANLLGALTDETGTGSAVFATSPTLVTPILGTPTSATLTNATGLPIATGVSGLGTGVATALAVNVGSAGAPVVNGGALGTPSSGTVTNLTGTASININGTVGATTPTTGAFTTLAASSSVTLSGGTANGVTYLNGSKVLTSGSALVFDGTTLVSPTYQATGTNAFKTNSSSGQYYHFDNASGNNFMGLSTVNKITMYAGGAENLNFTSTSLYTASGINVGIGTSSPSAKLQSEVSGSTAQLKLTQTSYASYNFKVNTDSSLTIDKDGTTRLTVDSAGNLGIGTSSPSSKLDVVRSATTTTAFDESVIRAINTGAATLNQRVDIALRFQDGTYNGIGGISMLRESATARSGSLSLSSIDSSGNPTNGIRLNSTGAVALLGASTTANGVGITFPATQSASSDANTLDDYEEGTWTPSLGGNTTYSGQQGFYTKIGNVVTIWMNVGVITLGTGSTTNVTGLPFEKGSMGSYAGTTGYFTSLAINVVNISPIVISSGGLKFMTLTSAGSTVTDGGAIFGNSAQILCSVTYQT